MGIGIDEAGRGPVMGPLVICALYSFDPDYLRRSGARDSKVLDPRRREAVYRSISGRCAHSILVVPAYAIDEARSRMTMNDLEVYGFASVLCSLLTGTKMRHGRLPEGCAVTVTGSSPRCRTIMDAADVDASRFTSRVRAEAMSMLDITGTEVEGRHRADATHPEVSAASIIAKVIRDKLVRDLSEEIGEDIGSGYPNDPITIAFLKGYLSVHGELPIGTRMTWDTSRELMAGSRRRTLESFISDEPV